MLHIPFYLVLSLAGALVTALPVDSSGTIQDRIHERSPYIPQYNGLQGVFARSREAGTKVKKGGPAVTSKKPAQGPTCPMPKTQLKKPSGKPPTAVAGTTKPATKPGDLKVGNHKRDLECNVLYRRTVPTATVFTADPTLNSQGRSTSLGSGEWAEVLEDPLNTYQVIKKHQVGIPELYVKAEIENLSKVGQFAGKWGYMTSGGQTTYFIFMRRVYGQPMYASILWTHYQTFQGGIHAPYAKQKIKCAIWQKITYYASLGIRHPDLHQGNVLLSGTSLEDMTVDFVDWAGKIDNSAMPTEAELETMTSRAMRLAVW